MPMQTKTAHDTGDYTDGRAQADPGIITLGAHDRLQGTLVYGGDLRVQGTFEGEAILAGDLQVDSGGTVRARMESWNVAVRGLLDGEVSVRDRLLISGSATVTGNCKAARLVIEEGAVVNGSITMERPAEDGVPERGA